eukprot:1741203-Amphidinium_carterae.1
MNTPVIDLRELRASIPTSAQHHVAKDSSALWAFASQLGDISVPVRGHSIPILRALQRSSKNLLSPLLASPDEPMTGISLSLLFPPG